MKSTKTHGIQTEAGKKKKKKTNWTKYYQS